MRTRLPAATAPFLLLAGCAGVQPQRDGAAELARTLQGRVAAETRACVPTSPTGSLRVIDSRRLIYDGGGGTVWINRLRGGCPGLRPYGTLIVEASIGGQYCHGDHFRNLESGAIIPGPTCILGDFTAYRRPR